jgi:hypothetical protein
MIASALLVVTAAPPMDTLLIASPRFPPQRVAARLLIHLQRELIMKIGRLPDALEPGFHCVGTRWIRGFMTF